MKKLFAAILALGLIVAVSGTASAVDVKFGGSYYVVGVYDDNPSLADSSVSYSRAYFFQRIRLEPVFKIAEGLTFTSRMDAMEGAWSTSETYTRSATVASNVNKNGFDWERGYVDFATGIGNFTVGYQTAGKFGLDWADSETTRPRIKLTTKVGPVILIGIYEKWTEANMDATLASNHYADADGAAYYLAPIYNFKGGQTGVLYGFLDFNNTRPAGFQTNKHILYPYVKATFGSVYVEAELNYLFGKQVKVDAGAGDRDYEGWGAYLNAKTNFGPAAFGAQIGWSKADDPATLDKNEAGPGKGADWNPALIMMNDDLATWSGGDTNTTGNATSPNLSGSDNGLLIMNIYGNYKVTPKFSMGAAFTYAKADKVPAGWDKEYGMEFDVTASYKLYDNLTYMVGAGYLWTGDYYKLGVAGAKIDDDYILMNKLSLSF